MNYLYEDPRAQEALSFWAGQSELVAAGAFLWNSGNQIQKS